MPPLRGPGRAVVAAADAAKPAVAERCCVTLHSLGTDINTADWVEQSGGLSCSMRVVSSASDTREDAQLSSSLESCVGLCPAMRGPDGKEQRGAVRGPRCAAQARRARRECARGQTRPGSRESLSRRPPPRPLTSRALLFVNHFLGAEPRRHDRGSGRTEAWGAGEGAGDTGPVAREKRTALFPKRAD